MKTTAADFLMSLGRIPSRGTSLLGAALTGALGVACLFLPIGDDLAEWSYDLAFLFRREVKSDEAAIVYMDWDSHVRLGQEQFQRWDRAVHARLIDRLKQLHARAVVFDVVFLPATNSAAADAELVRAAKEYGKVAVGALVAPDVHEGSIIGWKLSKPFPALESVTTWGVVEAGDENRSIRQHYYRRDFDAPSLAWRAAELIEPQTTPDPFRERWFNYYGPPGLLPHYSYWEVLETNANSAMAFSNKVVFVGAQYDIGMTGGKGTDDFRSPYTRWTGRRSPGVEVLATAFLNIIRDDALKRLAPPWEFLVVIGAGALAGLGLVRCRPWQALAFSALAFLLVAAAGISITWTKGVWFPWLAVGAIEIPCALAWSIIAFASQHETRMRPIYPAMELSAAEEQRARRELARRHSERPLAAVGGAIVDEHPAISSKPQAGAEEPTPKAGQQLADHQLLRRIGKGAYGEVWLARSVIGTYHAVKLVHRSSFPDDAPFEREFNGLRKFTPISRTHPGFMHVLHVGRNDAEGFIYYVMEAADDESSGQRIDPQTYSPRTLAKELKSRKRLPLDECLRLGVDLADGLHLLHENQLIHRDIKPANIIWVKGVPKLADIGLVTEAADAGDVTYLGTKGYIPPEGPGTSAGDVYSLGKVLYEASVGLEVTRFPELPTEITAGPRNDLFFKLNEIILKACERSPGDRFASAKALHQALLGLRHQAVKT